MRRSGIARISLLVAVAASASASAQSRRVVAVCLSVPDADRKTRTEISRLIDDALKNKGIARADPAALAEALVGFEGRCPEADEQRVEFAKAAAATDLLVMRVSPDPVIVSGAIVAVDGQKYPELAPERQTTNVPRAKAIELAVNAFLNKLPIDNGLLTPLAPAATNPATATNPPVEPVNTPPKGTAPAVAQPNATAPVQPAGGPGWMPWATMGAGAVVAIVGGNLFIVARGSEDKLRSYDAPRTPQQIQEMTKLQGEEQAWRTTGTLLVSVGLATAAGGAAWFFLSRGPEKAAVSVLPLPGGAVVSASF